MHRFNLRFAILIGVSILLTVFGSHAAGLPQNVIAHAAIQAPSVPSTTYLPLIIRPTQGLPPSSSSRRVNAPHFAGNVLFAQTAIFWFGRVNATDNYADVRVGYNNNELYVHLEIFDRRLWYNPTPSSGPLINWDSVTLYLDKNGNTGNTLGANAFRFDAQINDWETRGTAWQASYRGNGSGWTSANLSFTTTTGNRWESATEGGFNNDKNNRGWVLTYRIPFASLGPDSPPPLQTIWGLAIALHDRDDATGTPITDKVWPGSFSTNAPSSWGQLAFGLPNYTPPSATPRSTVTIRNKLNGAVVPDAGVGGYTICGAGLDFWSQWGESTENILNPGRSDFNVQNQSDVADWPCFSKYYVTFPLNSIPTGKVIISATLTLHQFGNSDPSGAQPSLIQVLTVNDDWSEATITWNNAPLAWENIGQAWVNPLTSSPGWPGVARSWNISGAVASAYAGSKSLRIVLYSADDAYHSGKYFVASDTGDWNAVGRPTIDVLWGDP